MPDCKASGGQLGNVPTHPRPRALQAPLSAGISPPRPRSGAEAGDNSRQARGGDSMGLRSRMPFPVPVCPQSAVCSWLSHLPSLVYFLQLHNQHVTVYSLSSSAWPPYPPTTLSLFSAPPHHRSQSQAPTQLPPAPLRAASPLATPSATPSFEGRPSARLPGPGSWTPMALWVLSPVSHRAGEGQPLFPREASEDIQ